MIASEVSIVYKRNTVIKENQRVISSKDAYNVLLPYYEDDMNVREVFYAILLNRVNCVKHVFQISKGGITSTVVDVQLLMTAVVKTLSKAVILAHNHPSGSSNPSTADINLTHRIIDACKMFDVSVHDHVIMVDGGYYSFRDEGVMNMESELKDESKIIVSEKDCI